MGKPRRKPFPEYFKKSLRLQVKQKQAARRKAALEAKKDGNQKETAARMAQVSAGNSDFGKEF